MKGVPATELARPRFSDPSFVVEEFVVTRWLRTVRAGRIADLGSGSGRFTSLVRSAGHPVVNVDADGRILRSSPNSGSQWPDCYSVQGDIRRLPFDGHSFTGALALRVVHRLRDPTSLFTEVGRVLAPGGYFLVSHIPRPTLGTVDLDLTHFLDGSTPQRLTVEGPGRVATKFAEPPGWLEGRKSFEARLESSGFEVEGRIGTGLENLRILRCIPPQAWARLGPVAGGLPAAPSVFLACRKV